MDAEFATFVATLEAELTGVQQETIPVPCPPTVSSHALLSPILDLGWALQSSPAAPIVWPSTKPLAPTWVLPPPSPLSSFDLALSDLTFRSMTSDDSNILSCHPPNVSNDLEISRYSDNSKNENTRMEVIDEDAAYLQIQTYTPFAPPQYMNTFGGFADVSSTLGPQRQDHRSSYPHPYHYRPQITEPLWSIRASVLRDMRGRFPTFKSNERRVLYWDDCCANGVVEAGEPSERGTVCGGCRKTIAWGLGKHRGQEPGSTSNWARHREICGYIFDKCGICHMCMYLQLKDEYWHLCRPKEGLHLQRICDAVIQLKIAIRGHPSYK